MASPTNALNKKEKYIDDRFVEMNKQYLTRESIRVNDRISIIIYSGKRGYQEVRYFYGFNHATNQTSKCLRKEVKDTSKDYTDWNLGMRMKYMETRHSIEQNRL